DTKKLLDKEADSVYMAAVHPILAHKELSENKLIQKLEESPIERFIVTDSIPHKSGVLTAKFTVLSVADLLAEAIKRAVLGESLTELH
ncbi:unnamed protein product, partial [marine sediment metagenome]